MLEYVVPSSGHEWSGNEEVVETGKGITYFTDTCINCGAKKIALPTTAGNINGSIKESIANSYGYIKLNSNGDSISIDFYYPESTYVRVYQHAVYDYWQKSNYSTFTYRTTSSSGSSNGDYNFSLSVNSQIVDLTEASNYTYQDFFGSSPKYIEELLNQGFSPMADCLIGDAQLREGMNNLTYTRLAAYTFNIDYFVLVISNGAHEHSLSSTIYSDDNYHWRQCTDPNCPLYDGIVDKTPHEYYLLDKAKAVLILWKSLMPVLFVAIEHMPIQILNTSMILALFHMSLIVIVISNLLIIVMCATRQYKPINLVLAMSLMALMKAVD